MHSAPRPQDCVVHGLRQFSLIQALSYGQSALTLHSAVKRNVNHVKFFFWMNLSKIITYVCNTQLGDFQPILQDKDTLVCVVKFCIGRLYRMDSNKHKDLDIFGLYMPYHFGNRNLRCILVLL